MPPVVAKPTILTDPGFLWAAPLGTAEPTATVTASKLSDTIPVAWIPLGATTEGTTFTYSSSVEAITVAEFLDPIQYATTERSGSLSFSLADYTLSNLNRAMNGGVAKLTATGTGGSELTSLEPVNPGSEVRAMFLWQSTDDSLRILIRQGIQGGEMSSTFAKAPSFASIPYTINMEIPTGGTKPWKIWGAGATRV